MYTVYIFAFFVFLTKKMLFCHPLIFFFLNDGDNSQHFLKNLFIIYFWLCWVFISVRGLSLVVASGGHSSSRCTGLSLLRPLLLRSTGSRRAGSVVVAHGPSCSVAYGIFPDQGSNPCPLHWQADSQPLRHQGSPNPTYFRREFWVRRMARITGAGVEPLVRPNKYDYTQTICRFQTLMDIFFLNSMCYF